MYKFLLYFLLLVATPSLSQDSNSYYQWGGSSASLSLSPLEDHYAELTINNVISGGHDEIINFVISIEDLVVNVRVEHQYGNLPDRHVIQVSDGYYAEITDILVEDEKSLVIKIFKTSALLS